MYCKCDSGRRHAGLASSASWQRAAERYDDVKELIAREKFRFLAWGVGRGGVHVVLCVGVGAGVGGSVVKFPPV